MVGNIFEIDAVASYIQFFLPLFLSYPLAVRHDSGHYITLLHVLVLLNQ